MHDSLPHAHSDEKRPLAHPIEGKHNRRFVHEPCDHQRRIQAPDRNDEGFSIAQVLVAMVLIGILTVAVGLTAFELIGQGRETVLRANITTAAQAVETTLALDPAALGAANADGVPDDRLISALGRIAALEWETNWALDDADREDTVRIQTLTAGATRTTAAREPTFDGDNNGTADDPLAPVVPWLTANGGAVRLQIRNGDGAWMCALVVMRPRGVDADEATRTREVGRLRGIWYDSGATIEADGLHSCSPVAGTVSAPPTAAGTWARGEVDLNNDGTQDTAEGETEFQRTVPQLGA